MDDHAVQMCECGGVGCGRAIERDHAPQYRARRIPQKVCAVCRTGGCLNHHDEFSVNIPTRRCRARAGYDRVRATRPVRTLSKSA